MESNSGLYRVLANDLFQRHTCVTQILYPRHIVLTQSPHSVSLVCSHTSGTMFYRSRLLLVHWVCSDRLIPPSESARLSSHLLSNLPLGARGCESFASLHAAPRLVVQPLLRAQGSSADACQLCQRLDDKNARCLREGLRLTWWQGVNRHAQGSSSIS